MKLCECGCGETAPVAMRSNTTLGHVRGQPVRFVVGHNNRLRRVGYRTEDRGFTTPCWIWQGSLNHNGYGRAGSRLAHHRFYEEHLGPIPQGLTLDHLCRVRACINPEHLEPVTLRENVKRGARARYTGGSKLATARHAAGLSQRELALMLGVSQGTIALWEKADRVAPDGQQDAQGFDDVSARRAA